MIIRCEECPNCGQTVSLTANTCPNCFSEYIKDFRTISTWERERIDKYITSYKQAIQKNPDDAEINIALGSCYLKLRLYDFAYKYFEEGIKCTVNNSDVYYYAAITLLKGKRPFLNVLPTIRKVEDLIRAAISLQQEGRYYYLLAMVQKDFYDKKRINNQYTYQELIKLANQYLVTESDIEELFEYIPIPK